MAIWKRSPRFAARVCLDRTPRENEPYEELEPPKYDDDDQTRGHVVLESSSLAINVRVKVMLKGVVQTGVGFDRPGTHEQHTSYDTVTFLSQVLADTHVDIPPVTSQPRASVDFSYSLRDQERRLALSEWRTTGSRTGYSLPPSIDSRHRLGGLARLFKRDSDVSYRVSYSITVVLSQGETTLAFEKHEFLYFSKAAPQPPISIPDFPDEYVLHTTKQIDVLGRHGVSTRLLVNLRGTEPDTLLVDRDKGEAATQLSLILQMIPAMVDAQHSSLCCPDQCRLRARLRSTTIVTQGYISQRVPTLPQARSSANAQLEQIMGQWQTYDVAVREWSRSNGSLADPSVCFALKDGIDVSHAGPSRAHEVREGFTTKLSTPFRMSGTEAPSPTFFTSLFSRRYAIELEISFPASSRSSMKLMLPLQISG